MHVDELPVVGYSHHHPVTVDIADGSREIEVSDLVLLADTEETEGLAELKVVLNANQVRRALGHDACKWNIFSRYSSL